ncbi:MAG: hypothetical protein OEL84_01795 [Nitrosopumilus sp.]|nr:hypothetical protein [Nitrosopumilus sp.]
MNPKYSPVFFSGGIILILGFVLIGVVPISILSESRQDNDAREHFVIEENKTIQTESKFVDEMNCFELNVFITSFEKGWGSAIPLYNEKCS